MKRYLAFRGSSYYPRGGMGDFYLDFDDLDKAIMSVVKFARAENGHAESELWKFQWAHVYDCAEKCIAWKDKNS